MLTFFPPVCFVSHNCSMHCAQFYSAVFSLSLACVYNFPVPWRTLEHIHGSAEDCARGDGQVLLVQWHTHPLPLSHRRIPDRAAAPGLMSSVGQPLEVSSHIHSYKQQKKKKKTQNNVYRILLTAIYIQNPRFL